MKHTILLLFVSACFLVNGQVGINIENPLGIFHIDPQKNTTSATAGISDDVVVTTNGNVGLGTAAPPNKLSIIATGANTGIYLPNGASSGKVLTSDISGNGVWISGAVQYQTMVAGSANSQIKVDGPPLPGFTKITTLGNVLFDRAKDVYGAAYGWDNANQQYVAPVSGIYRISMNVYFQSRGNIGDNFRAYIHRNGNQFLDPGIVSVTDAGVDISAYVMGLAYLNKGDILDLRVTSYPLGKIAYWSGLGHTFMMFESL